MAPPSRPTALPTRQLGTSGMELTRVGFGAWAVGGGGWKFGWGGQEDRDSVAAIHHAIDVGINWIDTAPVYGLGHSEEIVGRALAQIPQNDRPFVFTKCGLTFDRDRPDDGPFNVMAGPSVRAELESSLRRLGVERIDLYQVHWPPEDGTTLEEYWSTMAELKREGKVRAVGLSNHDAAQLSVAEQIEHVDSLQPPFSMIHREIASDLLPACVAAQTGVIVYSPMQSGLLTGAMSRERVERMPPDDWRRTHEDFNGESLTQNLALVDALGPMAAKHDVSVGALAVAWTLSWPGVTGAIVGARSPDQIAGWIAGADLELDEEDLRELGQAIAASEAGSGPSMPGGAGPQRASALD
jgi:aryl-alcohol dehydrogenase-like predicted oxidoreductase